MTIIYGNIGDDDTRVLAGIWKNFTNAKVLDAFKEDHKTIQKAVSEEEDLLILCGHGSGEGLFGRDGYALYSADVPFIHAQYVIGVWCHAKDFAKKYHVKGFFTSMYISNMSEAVFNIRGEVTVSSADITESEVKFCKVLNYLISNELYNIKKWPERVLEIFPPSNEVEEFNHNALEYVA